MDFLFAHVQKLNVSLVPDPISPLRQIWEFSHISLYLYIASLWGLISQISVNPSFTFDSSCFNSNCSNWVKFYYFDNTMKWTSICSWRAKYRLRGGRWWGVDFRELDSATKRKRPISKKERNCNGDLLNVKFNHVTCFFRCINNKFVKYKKNK